MSLRDAYTVYTNARRTADFEGAHSSVCVISSCSSPLLCFSVVASLVSLNSAGMSRCFTRGVFRCFKWLERVGDRITGAAGPVFVALAVILLSLGAFCFCEFFSVLVF